MEQKFERVEKHLYRYLYRYQYQGRPGSDWSTNFYARFTCRLKKKRRVFPLGSDLKTARDELRVLEARNIRKEDFDLDRRPPEPEPERLTVAKYLPRFLETKKGLPSYGFWKTCAGHLGRLLGPIALEEITRAKMAEYKQLRYAEPIQRHGKPVKGTLVSPSTVNREITTLVGVFNLAAEDGVLEKIPATKRLKESEDHLARERVLDADEHKSLVDASPRWLQRVIIGAYEGCLSRVDLLSLTSEEVHRKRPETALIKIMGGRNKTKARQKIPISPALSEVLDELEKERRKLTSLHGANLVFTRDGKPITKAALRKAFDRALQAAGLKDFHFHDFRHCAVTRWTLADIPEDLRKLAAGHSRRSVHQRYVNPPDEQMVEIFADRLGWNCYRVARKTLRSEGQSAK
jgi:integrase